MPNKPEPSWEEVVRGALMELSNKQHKLGLDGLIPLSQYEHEAMAVITDAVEKQIEEVLDRLESEKKIYVKHAEYVTELNEPPLVITTDYKYMIDLGAIEAEHNKLKESNNV